MKNTDFAKIMGKIDNDIIEQADNAITVNHRKSKKLWLKWGAMAACFCLIITSATVIPDLLKKPFDFGKDGKINILSITDATQVDISEKMFYGETGDIYPPEEFVKVFRNNNCPFIYGTAKNIKSVSITDDNFIWYITTFEIDVIDAVKSIDESSTIKVVSISCYDDGNPHFIGSLSSKIDIANQKTGLFLLKNAPSDKYEINGTQYSISDFADYYVMHQYDCDGKFFNYYGTQIEVDALRN